MGAQVAALTSPLKRKMSEENYSSLPPLPKLQKIQQSQSSIVPLKSPCTANILSSNNDKNTTQNNKDEDELEVVVDDEITDEKAQGQSLRDNKEHTVSIGSVNPVHMTVKANKIWSIA